MTERQSAPRPSDPRHNDPRAAARRMAENPPAGGAAEPTAKPANHQPPADQSPADQPPAGRPPAGQPPAGQQAGQPAAGEQTPGALLSGPDLEAVTRRWHEIQGGFVDAPQQAVRDADALVADLMNRVTQMFTAERDQLESQWSRGDQVSTEDLRVALQRYRSFFQRLLSLR